MTTPHTGASPVPAATGQAIGDSSVGELLSHVAQDLSVLMRQEIELAKAEVRQEVAQAGKAAGMFGVAGFAGYMVLLFGSAAAWWGLATIIAVGWAALVVAAIWAVIGAVLFVVGRQRIKQVNPTPERTVETVKEIPGTLKGQARN